MAHLAQPLDDVPMLDVEPLERYELRQMGCAPAPGLGGAPSDHVGRRGFLRVVAAGGMALGLTVLGWLPPARRAFGTVGTEHLDCASFDYDGILCSPNVYSPANCGEDGWFRDGCIAGPDGGHECYRPVSECDGRSAWRWWEDGVEYRCADGEVKFQGAPRWDFRICNAELRRA